MIKVEVPKVVQDELLAAAAAEYNRECMGLLFGWVSKKGTKYEIDCAIPIQTARRTKDTVYVQNKDRKRLDRMVKVFAPRDISLVGFYHSHPNYKPSPSPDDIGATLEDAAYMLPKGRKPIEIIIGVSAKKRSAGRVRFVEKEVKMNLKLSEFKKGELPDGERFVTAIGRLIRVPVSENRYQEYRMAAWAFYLDPRDQDIECFEACQIKVTS